MGFQGQGWGRVGARVRIRAWVRVWVRVGFRVDSICCACEPTRILALALTLIGSPNPNP